MNDRDASLDDLLRALAHERRRHVLSVLQGPQSLSLDELSERVVAGELGTTVADVRAPDIQACSLDLYHYHLPMLETVGLVRTNEDSGAVTLTERGENVVTIVSAELSASLE